MIGENKINCKGRGAQGGFEQEKGEKSKRRPAGQFFGVKKKRKRGNLYSFSRKGKKRRGTSSEDNPTGPVAKRERMEEPYLIQEPKKKRKKK